MVLFGHVVVLSARRKRPLVLTILLAGCLFSSSLGAQEIPVQDHRLAIYANKAWQDADYEQHIYWHTEEDEVDYWTDQRAFESMLHKAYPEGFQVYINNKRAAYREHQLQCGDRCDHGDYYQLQASYYFQNGVPLAADSLFLATSSAN